MKTKIHSSFLIPPSACCLVATLGCSIALPIAGQNAPPLTQIVSNVVHFTQPTEACTVTVNQTLTLPVTNTAAVGFEKASAVQPQTVETFDSTFEPKKREWVAQRSLTPTPKAAGTSEPGTNQPPAQPRLQITLDLAPFLESLLGSSQASVTREACGGRTCYRIEARSGAEQVATLWVDAQNWQVPRAVVYLMNRKFADVDCEYREVDGRWLFSKVVINHTLDGSRAELEFGEYRRVGLK